MVVVKEQLIRYEGGHQDVLDEEGDVVFIDAGEEVEVEPGFDPDNYEDQSDRGVAISLGDRALVLAGLAQIYARQARATGFAIAHTTARYEDQIDDRYPGHAEEVVANTIDKAVRGMAKEDALIARLVKKKELVAAGFDPDDIDVETRKIKAALRAKIGVSVGKRARDKVLKGLYNPES